MQMLSRKSNFRFSVSALLIILTIISITFALLRLYYLPHFRESAAVSNIERISGTVSVSMHEQALKSPIWQSLNNVSDIQVYRKIDLLDINCNNKSEDDSDSDLSCADSIANDLVYLNPTQLLIRGDCVTSSIAQHFPGLQKLRLLFIKGDVPQSHVLSHLKAVLSLNTVILDKWDDVDRSIYELSINSNINRLVLHKCNLSASSFNSISDFARLRNIWMSNCRGIDSGCLLDLRGQDAWESITIDGDEISKPSLMALLAIDCTHLRLESEIDNSVSALDMVLALNNNKHLESLWIPNLIIPKAIDLLLHIKNFTVLESFRFSIMHEHKKEVLEGKLDNGVLYLSSPTLDNKTVSNYFGDVISADVLYKN